MVSGMNFVHHISRGFRDISGGYTPSITHTMAHELGHGLFGLDHIFSGAYGIKKGATYNLMDYTEKTPNDALSYHEWTQINLPLPSWSALSRAEEDMWLEERVLKAGEFVWEGDWLCGYYPDELEEKVNDLKPLFDHIRNNYASYWEYLNSKKKDLDVDGFGEWSVRKFSIKEAICKSLYEKLSKKGTPSFDLHEKGIFLQPYVMNVNGVEKSYEVSVYSFKKNVEVDCNKFKLQDLSDLAEHQYVKAAYCNDYGLVALYDEGKNLNMVIQVWSKDGESPQNAAINWLNYLNIVSQSGDADAKAEENKKQTDTKINESNPTGWSIDKCKQLVQRMYDNLSEWAKGLLPEEDLPVVWGEKLLADRYIVSDAQALIRDKNGKELEGKPKIPQGTEVKIVPNVTTTDGAYIQVEVVGSNPKQLHYTAASNLTKIEILEKPEKKEIKRTVKSVRLPFANEENREIKESEEYYVVAKCGSYLRISNTENVSWETSEGYWVKQGAFIESGGTIECLIDEKYFFKQRQGDCYNSCVDIIKNAIGGIYKNPGRWALANVDENNNEVLHMDCYAEAIKALDVSLENGVPVIVGLDWKKPSVLYNFDKVTDHWVIIVGRDSDDEGVYYTYFEVAQSNKDKYEDGEKKGTSAVYNRFYKTSEGYLQAKNKTQNKDALRLGIVTTIEINVTNCCCSRNYFEYGKTRNCDCEEKEFHNRRNNNGETGVYEQNRAKGNLLKFR